MNGIPAALAIELDEETSLALLLDESFRSIKGEIHSGKVLLSSDSLHSGLHLVALFETNSSKAQLQT